MMYYYFILGRKIIDIMYKSQGYQVLLIMRLYNTDPTAIYTLVCHTAQSWKIIYSLYRVVLQMLKVSVTLLLRALTVPLFLTAVIV